jgi:hypothetical protein
MPVIKKTIAIHPVMDQYVRKTWAMLVEGGCDATYSTAVNFMLLATILEASGQSSGLSKKTRELIWAFAGDQETIDELNLQDQLANVVKYLSSVEITEEQRITRTTKVSVKQRTHG